MLIALMKDMKNVNYLDLIECIQVSEWEMILTLLKMKCHFGMISLKITVSPSHIDLAVLLPKKEANFQDQKLDSQSECPCRAPEWKEASYLQYRVL